MHVKSSTELLNNLHRSLPPRVRLRCFFVFRENFLHLKRFVIQNLFVTLRPISAYCTDYVRHSSINVTTPLYIYYMRTLRIATLVAMIISLAACQTKKEEKKQEPISVKTEVAASCGAEGSRTYVGTVEELCSTPVSFTGVGTVTKVHVKEGQHVRKGQLIAELDPTQARNMLSTAEAQLAQAKDALGRLEQLHTSGSLPEVKWVEIQTQVSQAETQVEMCRKNLADCRLYAPASGIVANKMFEDGMTAVTSEPLLTILDITSVKVRVAIPEQEFAAISASTASTVAVAAIERTLEGGRIEKGISADPTTHTYDIKINIPNADGALLPGMIANVTLLPGSATSGTTSVGSVTVPLRCVQKSGNDGHFVWIVKDGKAHRQPVTIGGTFGNRIAITAGLTGGERIITEGFHKVGEGTPVKS